MNAIRTRLLPEFVRRGFENVPLPPPRVGPMDRELIVTQPFGMLRRRGPRGLELVDIQLAPRGRAAFRLNIGVVPPAGIEGIYGHVAAEDVLVGWLNEFYELYQYPFFRAWFSVRRWPWPKPVQSDYDKLVERVVRLIPEVELALREDKQGPHVRFIKIDHPIEQIRARLKTDDIRAILLREWDPIDVGDNPNLSGEYDAYIPQIAKLVRRGRPVAEFDEHLKRIEQSLGSTPPPERRMRAATALARLARDPA